MKAVEPPWVRQFIWEIFIRLLLDRQGHIKEQIQISFFENCPGYEKFCLGLL